MPTQAGIAQALMALGFAGFSFILLRSTFQYCAERKVPLVALPALTLFGVLSAFVFVRLKLQDFFIWQLVFLGFIFIAWRRKSGVDAEALARLARQEASRGGGDEAEISRFYLSTRHILSVGFACYAATFTGAFVYLLTRP